MWKVDDSCPIAGNGVRSVKALDSLLVPGSAAGLSSYDLPLYWEDQQENNTDQHLYLT
jgi:hypothetical protein